MKYIIKDWAGNAKLKGQEFDSMEDADESLTELIHIQYPESFVNEDVFNEERGEFYIDLIEGT